MNFDPAFLQLGEEEKCFATALLFVIPQLATPAVSLRFSGTCVADIHFMFARAMYLRAVATLAVAATDPEQAARLRSESDALVQRVRAMGLEGAADRALQFLEAYCDAEPS